MVGFVYLCKTKKTDEKMSPRSVLWSLLCCVSMVFASCHHPVPTTHAPSADPALASVDSLMWQQPDSALTRLIPWFDTEPATEYDRHYAHLLLAELLYKNDYEQTNRKELRLSVDYFDSLADGRDASATMVFLDARAHYMNGVGYYERDSVVEACGEYLKAVEIMENGFPCLEKEKCHTPQFMALTCTHLTDLFSNLYLHEQALYFGKKALGYYRKYEVTPAYLAWILDEIGMHYDMIDNKDSALYYYQKAAKTVGDTNEMLYRDILTHQILLNHKINRPLDASIIQLHQVISKAQDPREVTARYLVLGEIFYNEQHLDSAWYYLNKVFRESTSLGSKKQAAEWLFEICKAQNKMDESYEYSVFLIPFANQEENKSPIKSQIAESYKSYHQQRQERSFKQMKKENLKWALTIFVSLLVITSFITILYHKNKKSLSGKLRESNKALNDALQKINRFEAEQEPTVHNDGFLPDGKALYEQFRQTPICQEILKTVATLLEKQNMVLKTDLRVEEYKSFALSNQQIFSLLKTIESYFPEMVSNWKQRELNLNRKDWLYLSLSFLQIDKMGMCILLQDSYFTCRRHIIKIEQTFNCKYGLTSFLMNQVNAL